ncbi:hypothetical protein GCM10029976_066600 [Kribbella albertanoniae]|uniref:hypothetical protein n=1 Tax=Kribbella albertanoniae TaxID=1266829 RepID=UPI00140449D3|nr:hypothetical protein [Kribbella albertanoniae]
MINISAALRWFPLVAHPRSACRSLSGRIDQLVATVRRARRTTGAEALTLAATVHHQAAIIASDAGLVDLARACCLQQLRLYRQVQPLDAGDARRALEPIVNLARLEIRAGKAEQGHQLLTGLLTAAQHDDQVDVAGHTIDFDELLTPAARPEIVRWLWTVLSADGTRALTTAGRWNEALTAVELHRGIGGRLLDGRQIAVIAHHLRGDTATARELLATAKPAERWEHLVRRALGRLCDPVSTKPLFSPAELERAAPAADLVVFRTRLILTAADLSPASETASLVQALNSDPALTGDAYAARDVLSHPIAGDLSATLRARLRAAVASAGLDHSISRSQLRKLLDVVRHSEATTIRNLAAAGGRSVQSTQRPPDGARTAGTGRPRAGAE